jgi:plastocyanin
VLAIVVEAGGARVARRGRSLWRLDGTAPARVLASALLLALVPAACADAGPGTTRAGVVHPGAPRVDQARTGTLEGVVRFGGQPPRAASINMASDPVCLRESRGDRADDALVVEAGGGLRNVFVYVKAGLPDYEYDLPATPVVLEQRGCRFRPRVLGVMVGGEVALVNADPTLHNVHAVPASNAEFSVGQTTRGMRHTRTFTAPEVMVPIGCDVHRWMRAHVGVLDHPFFAVTGDEGQFVIAGVPAGTYAIEAWHEVLGTRRLDVTIAPGETSQESFLFEAR